MKFPKLRRYFEMARSKGKSLNEVFATVPGSFESYVSQIRNALRTSPPDGIAADDCAYIESIIGEFPESVLVECWHNNGDTARYLVPVSMSEAGELSWGSPEPVEVEAVFKAKAAMESRISQDVPMPSEPVLDVSDVEIVVDESTHYASVSVAQRSDIRNRNGRVYPKDVLEDAVSRLQTRLNATGPLPMETMHREMRNIGDVCAIIHEVSFDKETGVVSLPKIEILDTSSGQNIKTLLEAGLTFQVSQRGVGISHEEADQNTGRVVQMMDWLDIQGWDMVWNGDASVSDAVLTLNASEGVQPTPPAPAPAPPPPVPAPAQNVENKPRVDVVPKREPVPAPASPPQATPPPVPQPASETSGLSGKEVLSLVKTAVEQAVRPLKDTLANETSELREKEFHRVASDVVDAVLAEHPRFTDAQKATIKSGIDFNRFYRQCETLDVGSITRVLSPVIEGEIERADKLIASDVVAGWNVPAQRDGQRYINRYGGVSFEQVITDAPIDGSRFMQLHEGAIDMMTRGDRENNWVMPLDHENMKPLSEVMDRFFAQHAAAIADETQTSGVGVPVSQVSMYLVPTVWRMTSAFQIAQMWPMTLLVEDIPIEKWTGAQSTVSDWERWESLDPGDSTAIPESVLDYEYYTLAAGYQPQHVRVTPKARAITRNTVMDPTVRSTALAAREIIDATDMMLWRTLIMEAMKDGHKKVSSFEVLSQVGSTNTWASDNAGWIPYESIVQRDSNRNPSSAGLVRNFPANGSGVAATVAGRTLQPIEVQSDKSATKTDLLYGTDYTVDFVKGTVTLTAAGVTKANSPTHIEAKYSYATNFTAWDYTTPSGSTFVDHLLDLRIKVADARTKVKNRHYMPECIAWNYGMMDKVSAGKNFTNEGGNAAQALDMMSTVMRYAGSESVDSTAIPEEYIIVTQKQSILYGLHTPFTLTGEVITDNTGDRRYFGEQFAGSAVPAPEKVSIVGVTNLPK